MATHNIQGIILRQTDYREADQLFNIYTDSLGKIIALGRGTKKVNSKLNCQLQNFSAIDLMVAPGRNFDHIAGADIQVNFLNIKSDFKKTILSCYALELIDVLTKVGEPDFRIYQLLIKYLTVLDENNFTNKEWGVVKQAFIIKLLTLLGLAPTPEVTADPKKLNLFLNHHLDSPLNTDKFISQMIKV